MARGHRARGSSRSPFSHRALIALIVVGAGSLIAAILFGVYGEPEPESAGANTFSRSAIGHEALLQLLDREGLPYLVSRHRSGERASGGSVLVVLEPDGLADSQEQRDALVDMLARAEQSLVVMPKWRGGASEENPAHLDWVDFVDQDEIVSVLDAAGVDAPAVRFHPDDATAAFTGMPGATRPDVEHLQVVRGTNIDPVIATDGGVYLGVVRTGSREVWLLSDPDVLQTHGLVRGDNADAAVAILSEVAAGRTLVFDETIHGFELPPSLYREMMTFPLVLVVLQAVLLGAAALWLSVGRFGGPREETGPEVAGQLGIIARTAEVLARARQGGQTITRFFIMHVRDVARRLGAPPVRSQDELIEWLANAGAARGVKIDLRALREDVRLMSLETRIDPADAVLLAGRIHRWKRAVLGASAPRSQL